MAGLLRLGKGDVRIPPEQRVVRAQDYQAWVEGEAHVNAARQYAAQIEVEAREAYEAEKQRGYEDGRMEAAGQAADQMMETVARAVAYFEQIENDMTELVVQATAKILGEFNELELVKRVVQNALVVMRNQKQVILRAPPELVEGLQKQLGVIMADYTGISFVEVTPDSRLRRGGCILESELGIVEASVDVQLNALRRALHRAFKQDK